MDPLSFGGATPPAGGNTPTTAARLASRVVDFQRNASFVAFMLVVVVAAFLIVIDKLRTVIQPLIWAIFFALPLDRAVVFLSNLEIMCLSSSLRLLRGPPPPSVPVPFWHRPGQSRVKVEVSEATLAILDSAINPFAGWPCSRRQVGEIPEISTSSCRRSLRSSTSCCRRRLRLKIFDSATARAHSTGSQSGCHALMTGGRYHLTAIHHASGDGGNELNLDLSLDGSARYPAVLTEEDSQDQELTGSLELDKTSTVSLMFAIFFVILLVLAGVALFATLVWIGAQSLLDNIGAYVTGVDQFFDWFTKKFEGSMSPEELASLQKAINDFLKEELPVIAEMLLGSISNFLLQAVFMVIYLLFWLVEPIPVAPPIAEVFKSYLFLKSCVCLLFATCMSILLKALNVSIWPLFFIVSFLLNYIPEVGSMLCAILSVLVVLFDGNTADPSQRGYNALILLFVFGVIKVVTGNIIEMRMYANAGGEFMRMHPVVLIAMMFTGEVLLGISGMFLSVPITAAVKYYLVTADMPGTFLDPLLVFIEGDEMAPHKNRVDRRQAEKQRHEMETELRSRLQTQADSFLAASTAPLLTPGPYQPGPYLHDIPGVSMQHAAS